LITLYGIPNCDTVKKARLWLEAHRIVYLFHDFKKAGIDKSVLEDWVKRLGWETVINRAGTTFRKLPNGQKANLTERKAIALMLAQTSMIKRPVLVTSAEVLVGFKPEVYEKFLG
jgi:arsenate reductase (glutaredoxin)